MNSMKKYLIYVLWLVGFFIFSEFLINVGLNSTYKQIERTNENDAISIYQQEATRVNGRIRGILDKSKVNGKYLKFDLYSKRNVLVGQKYIEINQDEDTPNQNFELLFKANEVSSYKVDVVNEKEQLEHELEIIPKDWNKSEIFVMTLLSYMIFW